jgi:hypothetical protein
VQQDDQTGCCTKQRLGIESQKCHCITAVMP